MPQELFGHNIKELQDIIRVFGHAMDVVSRSTNDNARLNKKIIYWGK